MFCGNCGHHIPDTNNFCTKCGAPLSRNFATMEEKDVFIIKAKTDTVDYTNHGEITSIFGKIMKKKILVDLSAVKFIDSVGIGTLVTLYYKSNRTKQDIKIIGVKEQIMKPIRALGVDNVLVIKESKDEAFGEWGITSMDGDRT